MTEDLLHHLFVITVDSIDSEEKLWEHYQACLKAHDWQWDESDDDQVQYIGSKEEDHIIEVKAACSELDHERAQDLFDKYTLQKGW